MNTAIVVIELLTLHTIDGRTARVNPAQITQLMEPRDDVNDRQVVGGVHCIVKLADGSFVSVAETCDQVQKAIGE